MRYSEQRVRWVRSALVYVLLLMGAACGIGYAVCVSLGLGTSPRSYARLEKALAVGAAASFLVAVLAIAILVVRGKAPTRDITLAGGVFAYEPKGSLLRVALIIGLIALALFIAEGLPLLVGHVQPIGVHVLALVYVLMMGYLAYVEYAARRGRRD